MKIIKALFAGVLAVALLTMFVGVPFAKEEPPPPDKMKKLSFPKWKEFKTKNKIEVVVVEHHEQPVATVYFVIKGGSTLDPDGKSSLASYTATLLNKGTKTRDSDELAEWIESYGGDFGAGSGNDFTFVSVSILSEYIDVAYEFLADIVVNPTFPDDELEKERKRVKTALEFELSSPDAMADRHFNSVVYGHHPYAIAPTVETVEAVTREDLVAFHAKNYVANNAFLFVVGDVKQKDVKKAVEKHFGSWQQGEPDKVTYPEPPERTAKNISLYHRPGSVQTNLYLGHLGLRPDNPDWAAVTVANKVLGGGATGRLFLNIREDKGWTYGAYSQFTKPVDVGYFRATANVRTEVTDSAMVEMIGEFERIVAEPVTQEELDDAKSYLIGNFPTTIETPNQIAGQISQVMMLGLGKKYLEGYRKEIAKVEVADAQAAMQTYMHPDRMALVLVGDANEVIDRVEPIAAVALYDIEGNEMTRDELAIQPSDYDFDTSLIQDHEASYAVIVQEMNLGDLAVTVKRTGDEKIESTSEITGMISMNETLTVGAGNLEPMGYDFKMAAGPQQISVNYTFDGGSAKGKIEGMPEGPKDVDLPLVAGTLLDGSLDLVITTLPLEVGKTFQFPFLDSQSGSLQSYKIEVLGEEELMVSAGSFSVFKVKVKQPDGDIVMYCHKEAPHYLVKQEMPAQGLTIELKSRTE
jgi:predicted Zn-dependent peptidase